MFKTFFDNLKYSREKNIGGTIKRLAQTFMWIDAFFFCVGGIVMIIVGIVDSYDLCGLCFGGIATVILGPLMAYLTNLPIYAFGELVENSTITAGKISLESAGTVGASEVIFGVNSGNKKQSLWTKMKESSDTDRKKAELDRLKEQGLITEEEYQEKANSDSVSTKSESDLDAGNNKETDKSKRKTELKRLKDHGIITEEEYLREIRRGE